MQLIAAERANSDTGSGCHAVSIAITYQRQGCEELLIFGHRTHSTFNTSWYLDRAFGKVLLREERGLCEQLESSLQTAAFYRPRLLDNRIQSRLLAISRALSHLVQPWAVE